MWTLVRRLVREDEGQELVEYALLVALVAVVSAAALGRVQTTLHDAYVSWDCRNQSLWVMPAPGSTVAPGCP
jgi:Flp pilus assembly pilin Flp